MYDRSQFRRGLDVYDRDNYKIGDVSDVGPNYLHLSTGFLGLGQDLYIPFSAIDRVDDRGAYLNASKNELSGRDWSRPPTEAATMSAPAAGAAAAGAAASTMRGTTPGPAAGTTAGATIAPEEVRGHNLCDIDGKQIGSISGVGANYFHVVTGLLGLGQDLYVPIDAVDHCTRSCCYVNMTVDQMKSQGWTTRPAGATTAASAGGAAAGAAAAPISRPGPVTPEGPRGVYRIPLREEEIDIHRHREQVGEVIVSKEVVEEQRTINVPVSHEEVRIERHRVTGAAEESGPITDESVSQTIRVPVYEERIDVEKHPHVVEEVVVSPEETTRQERVTETVRREVPRVRTTGEAGEFVEGEETIEGGKASVERTAEEIRREQQQQQRRAGE